MEDRYYIRFKGRVLGPMSGEKTKELVRRGQITRVHELSPDGIEWRKAEEFEEFYPKKAIIQATTELVTEQKRSQPAESAEWYVHMDGQNHGPVEESNIRMWISSGRVTTESLVWKEGMPEWLAAELVKPQWFAGLSASVSAAKPTESFSEYSNEVFCEELRSRVFWIYTTSIIGIFCCGSAFIFCLFNLVTLVVAPIGSGQSVIVRLLFFLANGWFSGFGLFCGILLLRYANDVAVLKHAPTPQNVLRSVRRLSSFWLFAGIQVLTSVLFFLTIALLLYTGVFRTVYLLTN